MKADDYCAVFVTVNGEEQAKLVADAVVGGRLAACASIVGPIRSLYWWDGKIQDDSELLLIMKTRKSLFNRLRDAVVSVHSYNVPEIVALPLTDGHEPYLSWISESTVDPNE